MGSTRIPFCVNLSAEAVLMYKSNENFGGKNILAKKIFLRKKFSCEKNILAKKIFLAKMKGIVYIKERRKVFAAFFQF